MHNACLISHLALKGDFSTSELLAINRCHISKGVLFISNICNHQGNHLQKLATDTFTTFDLIHDLSWPRKHHILIAAWGACKKARITLCDESKDKLRTPLVQWRLENNKYITSWQWFLSRDLRTLYYREHGTCWKYTKFLNRSHMRIGFQTDTKWKSECSFCSQVCIIILKNSTPTHLRIEATEMEFPPDTSRPPLDSA